MRIFTAALGACLLAAAMGAHVGAETAYPPVEPLLKTRETVLGQPVVYPEGPAEITSAIVTMQPGSSTGLHVHGAPLFAYVLEGALTVDYGDGVRRTYRQGDALMEAFGTPHDGAAHEGGVTRILVVFMGAEGVANTAMSR